MEDKIKKEIEKWELEDILKSFKVDIRLTKLILLFFIIISFGFRLIVGVQISHMIPIILVAWFLLYLIDEYFLSKARDVKQAYSIYFRSVLIELFLITVIIHFLGGVEWIGAIFYILIISLAAVALPKNKTRMLIVVVAAFYLSLVSLEFFEIIPHQTLFHEQAMINLYLDPKYVIVTSVTFIAFIFSSVDMASSFSETLKEKRKELSETHKIAVDALEKAEEAKKVLEVRVTARTRELEFLAENLETQVQERTEELEKKIKELEEINELMVGRELKMIGLKKDLEKMRKNSKK